MIVVVQLKIFIMHFSKINQTYYIFYYSFINESKNLHKILRNTVLFQDYYIFRVNSKKKILSALYMLKL